MSAELRNCPLTKCGTAPSVTATADQQARGNKKLKTDEQAQGKAGATTDQQATGNTKMKTDEQAQGKAGATTEQPGAGLQEAEDRRPSPGQGQHHD
ncbi:hypothetical protein [Mesorhizobium sp. M0199]|uniref:hypothetical protein n=1 Tax=Mesorhizobium sp. M0199 TaxID=2956911 RepID=UPI00333D8608